MKQINMTMENYKRATILTGFVLVVMVLAILFFADNYASLFITLGSCLMTFVFIFTIAIRKYQAFVNLIERIEDRFMIFVILRTIAYIGLIIYFLRLFRLI